MIISNEHKFIYIAVPKTGTTSVQSAFMDLKLANIEVYNKNPDDLPEGTKFFKHIDASELRWKLPNKFNEYFKFSFVRNPYSRAVSWVYYYIKKHRKDINPNQYSFAELIEECPWWIWKNQCEFLYEGGTNLVDFTGRVENLSHDLNTVCARIGLSEGVNLQCENKSKHPNYQSLYDDTTKDYVDEKYRMDLKYLDYEFGD